MNIFKRIKQLFLTRQEREEAETLTNWISESAENLNALRAQQINVQSVSDGLKDYDKYDKDRAWQKLESKLEHKAKTGYLRYTRYAAASVILLIGVVFMTKQFAGDNVKGITVYQSDSETRDVVLSDGTNVLLDAASILTVDASRSVSLEGRAYFSVKSDAAHPFKITTSKGQISVPGTQFSILADDAHTEIIVTEGKVNFTDIHKETSILLKGDYLYSDASGSLKRQKNIDSYLSWKNKALKLKDAHIEEVAEALSDYYKVSIEVSPGLNTKSCRINTAFSSESLEEALAELSAIIGLSYSHERGKVVFIKINC